MKGPPRQQIYKSRMATQNIPQQPSQNVQQLGYEEDVTSQGGDQGSLQEAALGTSTSVGRLAGRLKIFSNVWSKVTRDPVVRQWIQGYEIPFTSPPIQRSGPVERTWSDKEKSLIDNQINKLIDKGAIVRCSPVQDQFLSNIILVPKPDGTQID